MARSNKSVLGAIAGLVLGLPSLAFADIVGCQHTAPTIRLAELKTRCAMHSRARCKVIFSGVVARSTDFGTLYYQEMNFGDDAGAVIFIAGSDGRLRPLACAHYEVTSYRKPERAEIAPRIYSTRYGPLLDLPGLHEAADAHLPEDLLAVWRDGQWRPIEMESWKAVLSKRISPYWSGFTKETFDARRMSADVSLYIFYRGTCGEARLRFAIRDDRLLLSNFHITRRDTDGYCPPNPPYRDGTVSGSVVR